MRILVYEYFSSGALAGKADMESIRTEGLTMLKSLVEDIHFLPGIECHLLLDPALEGKWSDKIKIRIARGASEEQILFGEMLKQVDAAWLIAPEFDGILYSRARACEKAGVRSLGPSSAGISLTTDKAQLAVCWENAGVPTPPCLQTPSFPAVLKPRDGAGSQVTFLVKSPEELANAFKKVEEEGWKGKMILQPYMPGLAASLALIVGRESVLPLLPSRQILSNDGRFHYQGGILPLQADLRERAIDLGLKAVRAVPGLFGYVGVDMVLGEKDVAIEINPRLTTSYAGYRALASFNLAELVLSQLGFIGSAPELKWHPGPICYSSSGKILPSSAWQEMIQN